MDQSNTPEGRASDEKLGRKVVVIYDQRVQVGTSAHVRTHAHIRTLYHIVENHAQSSGLLHLHEAACAK